MRCPRLFELAQPHSKVDGWPFTEESQQTPELMPDGSPWPKISIVTPSYNQMQFLEETIRSVLLQGYPNLEYIIIDGGSTDGSIEIIKKYEPWLSYWVSEKDCGQSHAINKGFQRATGDIVAWINSDDVYLPGAFEYAVRFLQSHPDAGFIHGPVNIIDENSQVIGNYPVVPFSWESQLPVNHIAQQSVFISGQAFKKAGDLDVSLHYAMDYDLWLRLALHHAIYHTDQVLAQFRIWGANKTSFHPSVFADEFAKVIDNFLSRQDLPGEVLQKKQWWSAKAYWVAGLLFEDAGMLEKARLHLVKAINIYNLHKLDLAYACTSILYWPGGRLKSKERVDLILSIIPADDYIIRNFKDKVQGQYYLIQCFEARQNHQPSMVRRSFLKALRFNPYNLLNRGFLKVILWGLFTRHN